MIRKLAAGGFDNEQLPYLDREDTFAEGSSMTCVTDPFEDEKLTEIAYFLREKLGDSLSEGTPTSELKRAVLTILLLGRLYQLYVE